MEEGRSAFKILTGNLQKRDLLGRPRCRWEDNIRMDLEEIDINAGKGIFPVCLPVRILKALLPSSILVTYPAHLNLLDLITLTIVGERYKL